MGANSNKGRFSDRLKKMRRDRYLIRKYGKEYLNEQKDTYNKKSVSFLKFFLLPFGYFNDVFSNNNNNNTSKIYNKKFSSNPLKKENIHIKFQEKIDKKELDKQEINNNNKNRNIKTRKLNNKSNEKEHINITNVNFENIDKIHELEKEILSLIKKRLVNCINEYELIQSDLYILSQINSDDLYLEKCMVNIKDIKRLLTKIKVLKEKYDYLKDNYDFEYLLEIDDGGLSDKIIELRNLCSDSEIALFVDNYKLLDEYKYLYLKIDKLECEAIEYEEYKNKKIMELKDRDIDFDKFKNDIFDIDKINIEYDEFMLKQNKFLNDLEKNIMNIDSHEQIEYRLKGFNKLLTNYFKYFGLLMLSPLKGLVPSIAVNTLIAKENIKHLYNNLQWEENRKIYYETVDYSDTIKNAVVNIQNTDKLIDETLEDIINMKKLFNDRFKEYGYKFPEYYDSIKKLNKIENAVLGNKIKITHIVEKLKKNEELNENKMIKVKNLNEKS